MISGCCAGISDSRCCRDRRGFAGWLAPVVLCAFLLPASRSVADAEAADRKSASAAKAVAPAPGADRKRPPSWYAATVAEDDKGSFLMVHFWSKGPLFRSEAIIAGRRIVTIVNRSTYYVIDSASGVGVAIARSPAAIADDQGRGRPFGNELRKLLMEGGELIATEDSEQGPIDVYRLTDARGRRTLWMSTKDPQVPLRIQTYDRATATRGQIDYVNWVHGPAIWDEFFTPDPRIELERVSYEQYKKQAGLRPIGPAPVLYRHLLHGEERSDSAEAAGTN